MDQFYKEIVLGIKTEDKDVEKAEETFREFGKNALESFWKNLGRGDKLKKTGEDFGKDVANSINNGVKKGLDKLGKWFLNQFTEAWSELKDMVSSSYLTNATTRRNAFTYGMSASESYGFEQAKSMMGISEEDLMYMEPHQAEKFQELMSKYSEKYSELYDSGFFEKMMDYQIEMQEFQQDIKLEFVRWFVNNKDTIKSGMYAIMSLAEGALKALSWIVSHLGGGSLTTYSDSRVNNSNIITNNNINVDNTFNSSNTSDQSNLTNPGIMTYEQVLKVLNN